MGSPDEWCLCEERTSMGRCRMARSPEIATAFPAPLCRPALTLLGGFSLNVNGKSVPLPMHSKRVLAYVSLDKAHNHSCDRGILAERLWPEVNADRSRASLRTALWRIRQANPYLVDIQLENVSLGAAVDVDLQLLHETADSIMADQAGYSPESQRLLLRSSELLPGWDETWLLLAREQLRQTRLHALEAIGARLKRLHRYPEAIDAMLAVIAEEPLRESAHAVLIDIHLSEGNAWEALRQFEVLADLLWRELRLRPSPELYGKVGIPIPPPPHPHPVPRTMPTSEAVRPGIGQRATGN
jgi:DNA-binding SARP family transcriptional activator